MRCENKEKIPWQTGQRETLEAGIYGHDFLSTANLATNMHKPRLSLCSQKYRFKLCQGLEYRDEDDKFVQHDCQKSRERTTKQASSTASCCRFPECIETNDTERSCQWQRAGELQFCKNWYRQWTMVVLNKNASETTIVSSFLLHQNSSVKYPIAPDSGLNLSPVNQ